MLRKIAEFIKIFWTEPIKWLLEIKSPTEEWARWLGIPECEALIGAIHKYCNPLQELEIARNHFENCDPAFITAAIFELNAAECRVEAARRCGTEFCPVTVHTETNMYIEPNNFLNRVNGELEWDHKDMPLAPRLYRAHTCPNGDIGVGDFIGYQKEEQ